MHATSVSPDIAHLSRKTITVDFESYLRRPMEFSKEIARYFDDRASLVIFEVGACEGEDTIRLKRRFPNASIYAFEPLPENATKVQQNLEKYRVPDVEVFQLALSDTLAEPSSTSPPGTLIMCQERKTGTTVTSRAPCCLPKSTPGCCRGSSSSER